MTYVPPDLFKEVYVLHAGYLQGTWREKIISLGRLVGASWQTIRLLRRLKPQAVWGFGGGASFIPLLLSGIFRIPRGIYQLDTCWGRANRALLPFVQKVATAFEHTHDLSPKGQGQRTMQWVGFAVRDTIVHVPYPPRQKDDPFHLLVLGGSQGASIFSQVLPKALCLLSATLQQKIQITQQCRGDLLSGTQKAYERTKAHVNLVPFITDMASALARAHLVLTRAGASTIGEMARVGRPGLFVPYPHAAQNHQAANAQAVVQADAGWCMDQVYLTPESLAAFLQEALEQPELLARKAFNMRTLDRPDSAKQLAAMLYALTGGAASS